MKTLSYLTLRTIPVFALLSKSTVKVNLVNRSFSALLIICCMPLMALNVLCAFYKRTPALSTISKQDALGRTVSLQYFNHGLFKQSALLFSVVRGELNFSGVHFSDSLSCAKQQKINQQYNSTAGIFSFYDLHKIIGLVAANEEQLLIKQLNSTLLQRQCLIAKSLLCLLFYSNNDDKKLKNNKIINLFDLNIANVTTNEAINWITTHHSFSPKIGFYINVQSINLGLKSSKFMKQLQQADALFSDGSGMRLATKKAGYQPTDNNNGTDMLPHLCNRCIEKDKSLFLLGAKPGVALQTSKNLTNTYPELLIAGVQHGYTPPADNDQLITQINESHCDILLVALGSPIQESWILENRSKLKCQTILAVGGLFDFYSGEISRSPLWLRELGLEWVWRLIQEPKNKFYRYVVGNPLFLFRVYFLGLATKGEK